MRTANGKGVSMGMFFKKHKGLLDYAAIVCGDLLLAFAITAFWEPNQLVTGGVSGIAIIVAVYSQRAGFTIPLWITNLLLNIPLFLLGLKTMSRDFLIKTAFATFFLSVALYVTALLPPLDLDMTLAAVFGGVFSGLGLGLVFRVMATTGGTDLAASILQRHVFSHFSVARILFALDSFIIAAGLLAFGPSNTLYAIVGVFVSSKVTDAILEGLSFAKAAFIISDCAEPIAVEIMTRLSRGITGLKGQGMFTKQDKNVLLCVVSAKELVKVKAIVHALDRDAFVVVADVREVLGLGFKQPEHTFPMQM